MQKKTEKQITRREKQRRGKGKKKEIKTDKNIQNGNTFSKSTEQLRIFGNLPRRSIVVSLSYPTILRHGVLARIIPIGATEV